MYAILALYAQVTCLWEAEARDETAMAKLASDTYYRAILYLRPDLRYYDNLVVVQILQLTERQFLTPRSYAHGLNDR